MYYTTYNEAMQRLFGEKVYKLSLSSGCSCPNRDGTLGSKGCSFCADGSGDFAEIGCGAVLNPGSVIGRNSTVYPLCSVRGCIPEKSIFKSAKAITPKYPQKQEAP